MATSLPLVKAGLFRKGIIAQDILLPILPQPGSPPHSSLPPHVIITQVKRPSLKHGSLLGCLQGE